MKNLFAVCAALLMLTAVLLTACKDDETKNATPDSAATQNATVAATVKVPSETTAIVETTADGKTIQKDSEGNELEFDASGDIVSIKDTKGNPRVINEYLEDHYFVTPDGAFLGNPDADNSDNTGIKPGHSGDNDLPDPQPGDLPTEYDPEPAPSPIIPTEDVTEGGSGTPDEKYELPFVPS